jgi:hypothetical protein
MIIFEKIKQLMEWSNQKGVPVPLARIDKKPSVSFTLLIMSATFVMLGLIDPVVKLGINVWEALAWHVTSAVLYYNRSAKISKDGVEISSSGEEKKED